jgi:hypothetical protein
MLGVVQVGACQVSCVTSFKGLETLLLMMRKTWKQRLTTAVTAIFASLTFAFISMPSFIVTAASFAAVVACSVGQFLLEAHLTRQCEMHNFH